jgi:predicted Rossmann fold flavoprotein
MPYRNVVILGAGAAGLMCAIEAGKRGRSVTVIDHAKAPGEKIRISGGGRCNFTNIHSAPKHFLSANPHFAKSALARYTPADFIALVDAHGIAWHEKTLGQLFCDRSARDIIAMLTGLMSDAGCEMLLSTSVETVERRKDGFCVSAGARSYQCDSLVIATGGKSIPKMGATGFGYDVARQFGLRLVETRPALVPFTWGGGEDEGLRSLSGLSVDARVSCNGAQFDEALLLTHRGMSGPSILQISSYWREGDTVDIDFLPAGDVGAALRDARKTTPKAMPVTALANRLPRRLAETLCGSMTGRLADTGNGALDALAASVHNHAFKPGGTEGYRTAEVTLGGVDTRDLDQKTLAARNVPGLYFIGEVVDVTGHLGGHNFQWAWASGHAAGQAV